MRQIRQRHDYGNDFSYSNSGLDYGDGSSSNLVSYGYGDGHDFGYSYGNNGHSNGYGSSSNKFGDGYGVDNYGNGEGYGPWWAVQGPDVIVGNFINREGYLDLPVSSAIEFLK